MKIATKAAAVDRRTAQKERKRKMIFPIVPSISKGNTTGETFFFTNNGEGDLVVMDIEVFTRREKC